MPENTCLSGCVACEAGTGAARSPIGYRVYQHLTGTLDSEQYHQENVNKLKELTTYSLVETERKSPAHGPMEYENRSRPDGLEEMSTTFEEAEAVLDAELEDIVREDDVGRGFQ